jgi:hypothetical protein
LFSRTLNRRPAFLRPVALGLFLLAAVAPANAGYGDLVLDNGTIRLSMDPIARGGAITYLGLSGSTTNLINNYDRGRQVQQSYYAGERLDRRAEGQHPSWSPWPWNPIQVGDAYGASSQVVTATIQAGVAYVKTIPLLWDMNYEPAQCTFESWVQLEGSVAHVRNRLVISRTDDTWTQVIALHQELPAAYTITQLSKLMTYVGTDAWHLQAPRQITRITIPGSESFPWNCWPSDQYPGPGFEPWAATVNSSNWGVGVFNPQAELMVGGQVGAAGGGEYSSATKYMSPLRAMAFGKTDSFEHSYDLIVGTVDEIRSYVYARMSQPTRWLWETDGDFEGWSFAQQTAGETVAGGALRFDVTGVDPILLSDRLAIAAPLTPYLHLRMRNGTASNVVQFFWTNEFGGPGPDNVATLGVSTFDTEMAEYVLDLSTVPGWRGTIRQLRFDPAASVTTGTMEVDGLVISNSSQSPWVTSGVGVSRGADRAPVLRPNAPNPFAPPTEISFRLPHSDRVRLQVIDPAGRVVRTLYSGDLDGGEWSYPWDGRDGGGRAVGAGVYFYRLVTGHGAQTRKMSLVR